MNNLTRPKRPRSHNRVAAVMAHTTKYAFKGRARLAADAGVSRSALTRLMSGARWPGHVIVGRIAGVLERELGKRIDCRELVSETGEYPTRFVCELVGCRGCKPPQFYSPNPAVEASYADVKPGFWTGDNQEREAAKWQPIEEVK